MFIEFDHNERPEGGDFLMSLENSFDDPAVLTRFVNKFYIGLMSKSVPFKVSTIEVNVSVYLGYLF